MGFEAFLKALPEAAKSPLGLVAFAFALAAWVFRVWSVQRPQLQARKIVTEFKDDKTRLEALRLALKDDPPASLQGEAAILDWVKTRAKEKSAVLLLVAYVSSLAAVVLIAVVAFTRPAPSATRDRAAATVRLIGQADDACTPLPPGARLVATIGKTSRAVAVVNDCEAQVSWLVSSQAHGEAVAATFVLEGAPSLQLAEPSHVYWLHPGDSLQVGVVPAVGQAPRVKILLLPYANREPGAENRGEFLRGMMEAKLRALSEQLGSNEPANPVRNLRLISSTEHVAFSAEDLRKKWVSEHLLEISSGILFSKQGRLVARSDLYLGELAEPSSFELDMTLDPDDFKRTNDSHALALVYALAADAERIKLPEHLISAYLQRATALCQELANERGEGIRNLKRSVASLLGRWDKTAATACN